MKRRLVLLLLLIVLGGCSQLGYYTQAARGQLELVVKQKPVKRLLADPGLDQRLVSQLELAQRLRTFALSRLGIKGNQSYTRYADLERRHVVWNLVAAPRFGVAPRTWCFPIAGCVAYKGFFREEAARKAEKVSLASGDDTFVYGVSAYSTLGWFDDPLLNTFIYRDEAALASLIFHELTHQVVYFPGDSAFNEAFATAVEYALVEEWFGLQGDNGARRQFAESRRRNAEIAGMVLGYRERLDAMYRLSISDENKSTRKAALFDAMRGEYALIQANGDGTGFYDWWFGLPLNNAHLLTVSTYFRLVPALEEILATFEGDLPRFFAAVKFRGPGILETSSH